LLQFGWRPAFVIVGLIGYLWLTLFAFSYRTPAKVVAEVTARPPHPWHLLRTRFLIFFALSKIFSDPIWYFYVFWLPKFLTEVHHFNLKQIVWLAPIPFIIADIGNLAGGGFTQLLIARGLPVPQARKLGAAIFGLLMCSAIPAIIAHDPYLSVAFVSIAMFGYTGYLANTLAFPAEVFPKNALGSIWGLASVGSGLGGMLFQWLSGRMVDRFGYYPVFIGYGIMPVIAVAMMLFLLGPLLPHPGFQNSSAAPNPRMPDLSTL